MVRMMKNEPLDTGLKISASQHALYDGHVYNGGHCHGLRHFVKHLSAFSISYDI